MPVDAALRFSLTALALCGALACLPPDPTAGSEPPRNGGAGGVTASGGQGSASSASGGSGGNAAAGGSGGTNGGSGGNTGGSPASGGSGGGTATGGAGADTSIDPGPGGASDASAETAPVPGAPSAGCGKTNPGGTFMIMAGSAQTPYRVVLPAAYDPKKPYPLVFYLHGRGNGIEGQGNLNRDVAMANLGIVVYPKSFGGSGWEVPGRDRPEENLALLRALIKHMSEQFCVDTKKVIMTGFSSGCWFASRLACTMKDELAGVVAAACGLDPMGKCPDRKPLTYIIGRGDNAFGGAPAAADFYRMRNGCQMASKPASTSPCQQYDGCSVPTTYCPHPGGHQWPAFASKSVLEMLSGL